MATLRDQKLQLIELLAEKQRRQQSLTVVGLVDPDKGLTHSIKKVSGTWLTTLEKPTIYLPSKLERLVTSDKRFNIIIGGRGSTKSVSAVDVCLIKAKDEGVKTYCLREYMSSIRNSIHVLLKEEIDRLELDNFEILDNGIRFNGTDAFQFAGISRNVDSIKSAHGFRMFEIEEAQFLSAESLETLTPTARNKPNKGLPMKFSGDEYELRDIDSNVSMIFIANPQSSNDPFSQRFIEPFKNELLNNGGIYEDDLHLIVEINYTDNPWFGESGLEKERAFDYENKSRAAYNHIWLGAYNDEVPDSIIPVEWFDAAIDAHKKLGIKPKGIRVLSHDPADSGDAKAIALRHGVVLLKTEDKTTDDVNECCDWSTDAAINNNVDLYVYDSDGLGVSLRRQINENLEGKRIDIIAYRGSEGVKDPAEIYQGAQYNVEETRPRSNKEIFKNRRAQGYWSLADRFYAVYRWIVLGEHQDPNSIICICSEGNNIAKLRAEICRIPRKPNGAGLIQIMTKQEMRAKKIKSPNLSDAVYMNYDSGITIAKEFKPLRFARKW